MTKKKHDDDRMPRTAWELWTKDLDGLEFPIGDDYETKREAMDYPTSDYYKGARFLVRVTRTRVKIPAKKKAKASGRRTT